MAEQLLCTWLTRVQIPALALYEITFVSNVLCNLVCLLCVVTQQIIHPELLYYKIMTLKRLS